MEIYIDFMVSWNYPSSSITNLSLFQLIKEDVVIIDFYISVNSNDDNLYTLCIGSKFINLEKFQEYYLFILLKSSNFTY